MPPPPPADHDPGRRVSGRHLALKFCWRTVDRQTRTSDDHRSVFDAVPLASVGAQTRECAVTVSRVIRVLAIIGFQVVILPVLANLRLSQAHGICLRPARGRLRVGPGLMPWHRDDSDV
jgi:hypothetical protein